MMKAVDRVPMINRMEWNMTCTSKVHWMDSGFTREVAG
jgi:hypothetical protein